MNLFQAFQSVKVIDPASDLLGQAGHVIAQSGDDITVEMDADGKPHAFKAEQLQGL